MSTEGRKSLGPGGRRFGSWAGRCCRWHSQLGAGQLLHCHAPGRAQDLVFWEPPLCQRPGCHLWGVERGGGPCRVFSLGESREKGPGAGCAMMEGMGKGYSSERPHLLGDSCLPDRHLLGDPSSSRGPCLELEAAVRKLLSEEVAASSSRQGPQLLPSVALV